MNKKLLFALGMASTMVAAGCVDTSTSNNAQTEAGDYGSRGLALTTDFLGGTDVRGMRYEIEKCGGGEKIKIDRNLEDLLLPGMIPAFENKPFDEHSKHLFADNFLVLPAGCYDVKITPIRHDGHPSHDCASAYAEDVRVVDKLTTEVLLVSQCKGPERGALDVVGALNHPPVISKLDYHPSKFLTCGEGYHRPEVTLCAKAYDPDSDPLEFEWKQVRGRPVHSGPTVIEHVTEHDWQKQCVKIKLPYESGDYEFELTVYDMFHEDHVVPASQNNNKRLIRAEKWFELNGYGHVKSHAKLRFPLYVSCKDRDDHCYDRNKERTECHDDHCYDENRHEIDCKEYCYDKHGKKEECREDRCYDEHRHEIDCEEELTCPHSQGYWKTHNKYAKNQSQKIPWPISEDTQMCGKSWLTILNTSAGGDAFYILAYQYIAARLNVANGGPKNSVLESKIQEAGNLLNQCKNLKSSSSDRTLAINLASYLEKYNTNKLLDCRKDDDSCRED